MRGAYPPPPQWSACPFIYLYYIYVFEFKLDAPLSDAMEQIDDRGYMIPYTADGRKLYKVGVVFSMGKRNVADYEVRNCSP